MSNTSYDQKLSAMCERIVDLDIRSTLRVSTKNRQYPKDCITNGALEQLLQKIIDYEKEIVARGGELPLK